MKTIGHIPARRTVALYGGVVTKTKPTNGSMYVLKVAFNQTVLYIDAAESPLIAGSINHSCDPNCTVENFLYQGQLICAVISKRALKPQEFLSINYGDSFNYIQCCCCGAESCRHIQAYRIWLELHASESFYTSFQ